MSIRTLDILSEKIASIDGIGKKTASRLASAFVHLSESELKSLTDAMTEANKKIHPCPICFTWTDEEICPVCKNPNRNPTVLCVVSKNESVDAMEKVREYRGLYHVLGGDLSPNSGITPDKLHIQELLKRLQEGTITEVILATSPTFEGEATAMYLSDLLKPLQIKVTRLAYGIPVGASLEFADEVTLLRALQGRNEI